MDEYMQILPTMA